MNKIKKINIYLHEDADDTNWYIGEILANELNSVETHLELKIDDLYIAPDDLQGFSSELNKLVNKFARKG